MSIHVGMHLSILILFVIYGIYSFIELNIISDMFLLNSFKYYDFSESPVIFCFHVIASSLFIGFAIHFTNNRKIKRKKEK